jgi:hypothetical protein
MNKSGVPSSVTLRRASRGSALVIVLFFVILLTAVTIAFLSRSLMAVRISASSSNETKAGILANSASDIIIGDLKQEIIAGSTSSGTVNWPVYLPTSNLTMIPLQNGVPTAGTLIPNMVSRSVRPGNTGGASPYMPYSATLYTATAIPPNRAADDTANPANVSSVTPSLNGRYISKSQWNSHYLIPRDPTVDTPGSIAADSTPVSTFVPPDWVVVTRNGANPVTWSTGVNGLNDATLTNGNYAIGRYAYAIYNEGGTLDMNVAGYPADTTPGGPNGLTAAQIAQKGSLALADLTQLVAGTGTLTQTQVNNIVGWRNYASAQLSAANGSYGAFSFTSTAASNWLTNFVLGNTNGFMKIVTPVGMTSPPTDQALLSRQQLITLIQSLNISPDYLQYMGTFSRALEQPSFAPDPNRPRVINISTPPPGNSAVNTYVGNNDSVSKDDQYNPSFLSIRVSPANWTRLNGTAAVLGEPLVKTKFPLNRLALVAYNATNASVQATSATTSDPDPIYDRFGLKRTSTSAPWKYNHGANFILTLKQVATAKREPDFAELLKAALTVGSLAKGAPNNNGTYYNWAYSIDTTTDYDVLQIMANLIDQYDTDSYPTQIEILKSTGNYHVFSGDEDLPSIYRWHAMSVVDALPSQNITQAQEGTIPASPGFTGGDVQLMYMVDLWNPHDASTLVTSSTLRPTKFRIYAEWQDPDSDTTAWSGTIHVRGPSGYPTTYGPTLALTQASTAITIADTSGGLAFREPTLIWRPNNPSGITISAPANETVTDAVNTGNTYLGFVVGSMPVETTDTNNNVWQLQALDIDPNYKRTSTNYGQITFALQYEDPNNLGSFITYNTLYSDIHGIQSPPNVVANSADTAAWPNAEWKSPFKSKQISAWGGGTVIDPRAIRFGVQTGSFLGQNGASASSNNGDFLLEPTAYSNFVGGSNTSGSATQNGLIGNTYTILETDRPRADVGNLVAYSNPCQAYDPPPAVLPPMRWYSGAEYRAGSGQSNTTNEYNGLLAQNTPQIQTAAIAQNHTYSAAQLYYEDADGVNRRAMGAYANYTTAVSGALDSTAADEIGIPTVTSGTYLDGGALTMSNILPQSQNRPLILNRPFRSVSDMSYTFRNSPWKNIDFFTPESGDTALLDTFCINDPPPTALVAGKVDLNTRQIPVLKALVNGAYRDELYSYGSAAATSAYTLQPITSTEAGHVATALVTMTTAPDGWRGPLTNIGGLVGRYAANPGTGASTATDAYSFVDPATGSTYVYAGLSATLGGGALGPGKNIYTDTTTVPIGIQAATPYTIQRFCEAGLRPLIDAGQVRVWNLLIDLVVQTGKYPKTATNLSQFSVDGQKRVWIHVAIDRYTGQIIDKQVEVVTP